MGYWCEVDDLMDGRNCCLGGICSVLLRCFAVELGEGVRWDRVYNTEWQAIAMILPTAILEVICEASMNSSMFRLCAIRLSIQHKSSL